MHLLILNSSQRRLSSFSGLPAGVLIKTLLKLDLVYCRESFSCKQCYNRALYKVSNLVSTLFFSLIKYLPQEKKAGIKYLNVSQSVLLKLFPSRANVKT